MKNGSSRKLTRGMSMLGIDDPEAAAKRWNHTAELLE